MSAPGPYGAAPTWVRLAFVALGIPNVVAGGWAVVAPRSWFDSFPGFDPALVAAEPPYNAHLATDAGAGLLASGAVLLLAAWLGDRRSGVVATVAFALFAVPHAWYHVANPAPGLTGTEDVVNASSLVFAAGASLVLLAANLGVGLRRRDVDP